RRHRSVGGVRAKACATSVSLKHNKGAAERDWRPGDRIRTIRSLLRAPVANIRLFAEFGMRFSPFVGTAFIQHEALEPDCLPSCPRRSTSLLHSSIWYKKPCNFPAEGTMARAGR
ncbi:hypothetical protein, partial [Bradyrhizobium sp.]|uniref:hypothetical protein n=1 Tax=Bradyrhizobium sp. TaxID=376 RepID=UPI0028FE2939